MDNSGKKLLLLAFWIAIAIFGIYMTFFSKEESESMDESFVEKEINEIETENAIFSESQDLTSLPMDENVSGDEMYIEGMETQIYFSNTTVIDEGNLPLEVQAVLVNSTQKFLNRSGYEDVTELYVDEESYIEDKEHIAFNCFMDGHTSQLRVIFEINSSNLKFSIIE